MEEKRVFCLVILIGLLVLGNVLSAETELQNLNPEIRDMAVSQNRSEALRSEDISVFMNCYYDDNILSDKFVLKDLFNDKENEEIKFPFVYFAKNMPARFIQIRSNSTLSDYRILINSTAEGDNSKETVIDTVLSYGEKIEIQIELGKKYSIEYYVQDRQAASKLFEVKNQNLFIEQYNNIPVKKYVIKSHYLNVDYYTGPSLHPIDGISEYTYGWANGITFGYSDSSFAMNLLLPKLLFVNNIFFQDSAGNTAVDSTSLLNVGFGLTWLQGFSIGYIVNLSNSDDVSNWFIGIDLPKVLSVFL